LLILNLLLSGNRSVTHLRLARHGQPSTVLPAGHASLLTDPKVRVRAAQLRAAVSVNRQLILLYWDIGKSSSTLTRCARI
jgi:hypothetical protein